MAVTVIPHGPDLLYVVTSIVIGSVLVNNILSRIAPSKSSLSSKAVTALAAPLDYIHSMFLRAVAIRNPLAAPKVPASALMSRGYLESLPYRSGPRPVVTGIARHRQISQVPSEEKEIRHRLQEVMFKSATRFPQQTYLGRSTFEKQKPALFARHRVYNDTKYYGEIVHAHPTDSSMHMTLHPADVKTVLEMGWGERHPLARDWLGGWWSKSTPVPGCYVMVYAPRDESELKVIEDIIAAAAWWVGGTDARVSEQSWS